MVLPQHQLFWYGLNVSNLSDSKAQAFWVQHLKSFTGRFILPHQAWQVLVAGYLCYWDKNIPKGHLDCLGAFTMSFDLWGAFHCEGTFYVLGIYFQSIFLSVSSVDFGWVFCSWNHAYGLQISPLFTYAQAYGQGRASHRGQACSPTDTPHILSLNRGPNRGCQTALKQKFWGPGVHQAAMKQQWAWVRSTGQDELQMSLPTSANMWFCDIASL